jgi:hypothetical protein
MVEIALCLGIIAIALVSIIGVLPTGIKVQKDNRQDTIINQDGTLLLEAIRGGARGLDYLTNHVLRITVTNVAPGRVQVVEYGTDTVGYSGPMIISLLGTNKYVTADGVTTTNFVTAVVRAISGSAVERSVVGRDMAFMYLLSPEVVPLTAFAPPLVDFRAPGLTPEQFLVRSNNWVVLLNQAANFHELRLTLRGPLVQKGRNYEAVGAPKTFRTLIPGRQVAEGTLSFFQPSTFVQVVP